MYQLNSVPNRVFPPLRVEKAQEEDVELDGGGSAASSVQSLQRSLQSATNVPPALQQKRNAAKNTILAMSAVMNEKKKVEWLRELSKEWRVHIPRDLATDSTARDTLLDSLASKLAPILAKKVQPTDHSGGGGVLVASTDRGTSEGTAPEMGGSMMMLAPNQQLSTSQQQLSRTTSGNMSSPAFVGDAVHGIALVE
eukprot:TRINITY_DN8078_c0_g1_i11.p1 TRINITY_DN8078_c0_g1~~TRINITY_DN8078_c0_g1_i11.p1  ORF type:complete len:196 (-),score=53.45 TRINITY_DN8078_c0_g1_i11:95-682(-)